MIENRASLFESRVERRPISEGMALDNLSIPKLMRPFGHALVPGLVNTNQGHRNAQGDEPQM